LTNFEIGRIFNIKSAAISIILKKIEKEIGVSNNLKAAIEELKSKFLN